MIPLLVLLQQPQLVMYDKLHIFAIFKQEIFNILLELLDKTNTLNFLLVSKQVGIVLPNWIFDKYAFLHSMSKSQSNEYKAKIKHLIFDEEKCNSLVDYNKLETILIRHQDFNSALEFVPETIKEITVKSHLFDLPVNDTFSNLEVLTIDSLSFNHEIDPKLIERLKKKCTVLSPTYGKQQTSDQMKIKSLMFGVNKSIPKKEIKLPILTPSNELMDFVY